jgi:hypothetical protein
VLVLTRLCRAVLALTVLARTVLALSVLALTGLGRTGRASAIALALRPGPARLVRPRRGRPQLPRG